MRVSPELTGQSPVNKGIPRSSINRISLPFPNLRPPIPELGRGQLKHEVGRETINIALNGLIQRLRLDLIQRGKFAVENDFEAANHQDVPHDRCRVYFGAAPGCHRHMLAQPRKLLDDVTCEFALAIAGYA